MKSKELQSRLRYPARLSFKIEGEIKTFPDKEKLKEFVTTKPVLQQMLKGQKEKEEEKKKKKKEERKLKNKMAINSYRSIITLNANSLNAPIKRHRVAEWIRKQDHIYKLTPRDTPRMKDTQTQSKGMEKDISCKWKGK